MRNFFLTKHHPGVLMEGYQENPRQKRDIPDTCTIVQSLSTIKCRVVLWFFPLRRWRLPVRLLFRPRDRFVSSLAFADMLVGKRGRDQPVSPPLSLPLVHCFTNL
jgi:hypothetical protein